MRRVRLVFVPALLVLLLPAAASAAPWVKATPQQFLDAGNHFTTDVELADLNEDGAPELLFANCGGWHSGTPNSGEPNQAFVNDGFGVFTDVSVEIFGSIPDDPKAIPDTGRMIKARDVNRDGRLDIFIAANWKSRSRLLVWDENNLDTQFQLTEVSGEQLPQDDHSIGDAEFGDVDGDGDLDLVLSEWGEIPVNLEISEGGRTLVWINDGDGHFTDETLARMPDINLRWSWDVELVDIDNDYDLDVLAACFTCADGGRLYRNNGDGTFTDITVGKLPQFKYGVSYTALDIDGDELLDLVSLQDGEGGGMEGFRSRVLLNTGGAFMDVTATWWQPIDNISTFDYGLAFADYDSDGDPDFFLASAAEDGDRLLEHQGGQFVTAGALPFGAVSSDGTFDIEVGDLNGDAKLDAVLGDGLNAFENFVFFGEDVAPDTAVPIISIAQIVTPEDMVMVGDELTLRARVHDNKTVNYGHDWQAVYLEYAVDMDDIETDGVKVDGWWYGEHLWTYTFIVPDALTVRYRYCAIDAAGNSACTGVEEFEPIPNDPGTTSTTTGPDPTTGTTVDPTTGDGTTMAETDSDDVTTAGTTTSASDTDSDSESATTETAGQLDDDGCDCGADSGGGPWSSLALLALLGIRRRRVAGSAR